jgi:hypothetical protein
MRILAHKKLQKETNTKNSAKVRKARCMADNKTPAVEVHDQGSSLPTEVVGSETMNAVSAEVSKLAPMRRGKGVAVPHTQVLQQGPPLPNQVARSEMAPAVSPYGTEGHEGGRGTRGC